MNPMPTTTGATILMVEDNPSARMALEALLDALGYKVLVAADAPEALALFQAQPDAIDLVMSDLILPEMGGPELCMELRRRKPAQRCMIMSGYPLEEESERLRRQGINYWLQKPFNMRQLQELLQAALQS